jgi:hypothetical protein
MSRKTLQALQIKLKDMIIESIDYAYILIP